jgi:RsiW-degrading membrane proteinase PrsW (M82 family)
MVCGAMAGLLFAVIENVLYLKVYIPDPSPALVLWRWTVCVALHTGCSLVAASGVARVRTTSLQEGAPPALEHGARRILLAVVLHGVYNALALLLDPLFAG